MVGTEDIIKPFHGKKDGVQVTLDTFQVQGKLNLLIQLTDIQKCSKFNLQVGNDFIQAQDFHFTSNIESIQDLYQYMVKEFDQLIITRDGVIIVVLEVMVKKKLEKKEYRMQAKRQQIDPLQQMQIQIQQMRRELKEYKEKNDKRIQQLESNQTGTKEEFEKQYQGLVEEIGTQINTINSQRESDLANIHTQILKIREELERSMTKAMLKNEQTLLFIGKNKFQSEQPQKLGRKDSNTQTLSLISRTVAQQQGSIKSMEFIISQLEERKQRVAALMMSTQNPHRTSFKIREEFKALLIQKNGKDGIDNNYIASRPLTPGKVQTFQMKLLKTRDKQIIFGVGTRNAFQLDYAYQHKQTLSYLLNSGVIYELGSYRFMGSAVPNGNTLQMRVDLNENKIEWRVNRILSATANIIEPMRSAPLYLFIMMYHAGDEVQLFL